MSTQAETIFRLPLPQELQAAMLFADVLREADPCPPPRSWFFLQVHT